MIFLNSSILYGILAISIPIILHFFNLRRIRKVEFSTLMFLKELQKTKIRRIRLRQILLLIIRCLIISFLVLAFADPVYKGMASEDKGSGKNIIIIVDNSFSMEAQDITGTYLAKAKQEAFEIINKNNSSNNNSAVYAISSSGLVLNENFYNSITENVIDSIKNIGISFLPLNVSSALTRVGRIIENDPFRQTEIYFISDLAKNCFTEQPAFNKYISGNNGLKVYFVNTGNREVNNISIEGIDFRTSLPIPGNDINISVKIKNHNTTDAVSKSVTLYIKENGEKGYTNVAQKVIDILAGDEVKTDFTFKSLKGGSLCGYAELSRNEYKDDEIIKDNKYYFSLNFPSNIKAGIIASGESSKYLSASLRSFSFLNTSQTGKPNDILTGEAVTPNSDLFKYDILYVTLDYLKDENFESKLKAFADSGRSVFLFPSASYDITSANRFLKDKLGFCFINSDINSDANKNLKLQKFDKNTGILEGIFKSNEDNNDFKAESPVISRYLELIPSGNSSEIMTLNNGKPLLLKSIQPGKNIFLFALSADMIYSDLPLKSIFAPVIVRSAFNSVSYETPGMTYKPGSVNIIPNKNLIAGGLTISSEENPEVKTENLNLKINSDQKLLVIPVSRQTSVPGNYFVNNTQHNLISAFSLNHDTLESDMSKISDNELKDFMTKAGIEKYKKVQNSNEAIADVSVKENGVSLWKYFILAAFLMLAGEILLSKSIDKG